MIRRHLASALTAAAVVTAILAAGCTEKVHPPTSPPPPGPSGPLVTPDSVQTIFSAWCTTCHYEGGSGDVLVLTPDSSYVRLVNVESVRSAPDKLVLPADPDASVLVGRIEGTIVPRMPYGGPMLPAADIATIRNWISQGAPGVVVTGPS
jgi:hypothetical protein